MMIAGQRASQPIYCRDLRRLLPAIDKQWFSAGTESWTLHVDKIPGNDDEGILFLHDLLGHGRNLRTVAKQVCDVQHHATGYLMDLRGHGKSRRSSDSSSNAVSPNNFANCVKDIRHTIQSQSIAATPTLVGHSWGGRMALQYASEFPDCVKKLWLLDVVPGKANESVERVVSVVSKLQDAKIASKKDLVERLTKVEGLDMATSQWLASSYKGPSDFGFDLQVIQDILPEFGSQDMEGMITSLMDDGVEVNLVRGGKNTAWDIPTLNRLESLSKNHPSFGLYVLPKAGHWVHVDDLKGLVSLFTPAQV